MSHVIAKFNKTPSAALVDVLINKCSDFVGVTNVRLEGLYVVADTVPSDFTSTFQKLSCMVEGILAGYKAAMPPSTPYSIKYERYKFRAGIKPSQLCRDLTQSEIPSEYYNKKIITESFATWEEAHNRVQELQSTPQKNGYVLFTTGIVTDPAAFDH